MKTIVNSTSDLEELIKRYKTDNWGYTGQEHMLEVPGLGVMLIQKMPSGDTYVKRKCGKNSFTWERMNDAWFDKMKKLIDKENYESTIKDSKRIN